MAGHGVMMKPPGWHKGVVHLGGAPGWCPWVEAMLSAEVGELPEISKVLRMMDIPRLESTRIPFKAKQLVVITPRCLY